MNTNKKQLWTMILISTIVLFSFEMFIYGYAFGNGAGNAYSPLVSGSSENTGGIEGDVVRGIILFSAEVNIKEILRMVEMQDTGEFDYVTLNAALDNALANMGGAIAAYDSLMAKASVTPYNETFISLLKAFDYDGFRDQLGLNAIIFDAVEDYSRKGDITGMFRYIHSQFWSLKEMLLNIKNTVAAGQLPELAEFWTLNERCSGLSTFGSYGARIFYANI